MSPLRVDLYAMEGESVTRVVEVKSNLNEPMTLAPLEFQLQEKVTYEIEEIEKGRLFRIRFTNIPGPVETFRGSLRLKTNYREKPVVTITIWGRIAKRV